MHTSPSTAVAYGDDGRLYSAGYDGKLLAWDGDSASVLWSSSHDALINSIAVHGEYVITASADRSAIIWNRHSGKKIRAIAADHDDDLNVVRVSSDGNRVVVGGEEGRAWLYAADSGEGLELKFPSNRPRADCVDAVGFVRFGDQDGILVGDSSGWATVFAFDGNVLFAVDLAGTVEVAEARDGHPIAYIGMADGRVFELDFRSEPLIGVVHEHTSAVKALALSGKGHLLVSTAYDGKMISYACPGLSYVSNTLFSGNPRRGWARGLSFDPLNPSHVACTSLGRRPEIWNAETLQPVGGDSGETFGVNSIAVLHNTVLSGGDDGVLRWLELDGKVSRSLSIGPMINGVATLPSRGLVAAALQDGRTIIIDQKNQETIQTLPSDGGPAVCCAFSPSGGAVATGTYNGAIVVSDEYGQTFKLMGPDTAKSLQFLDASHLVVGGADGNLLIFDIRDQSVSKHQDGLYLVNSVSWNATTKRLLTVGRDRMIRLWDSDLILLSEKSSHQKSIKTVSWNPSGTRFATSGYDSVIRVHSIAEEISNNHAHNPPGVPTLAWLNDKIFASAGWDGTVRWWQESEHDQSYHEFLTISLSELS